jgi:pimeloyl-ACP methyl ester carboxylesterase
VSEVKHEEVRFQSGDVALAGTFVDVPNAAAAAVILTGSGRLDRDSNGPRFRGQISPAISRTLASHGVASLRYDKRGVGESGGDYFEAGLTDNYADAGAAVDWLAARCPALPVYAVGHSEGALHVARLAAADKVAGAGLIACPARTGEAILTWQAAQVVPTLPAATKAILRCLHIDPLESQRKAFERIRSTSANTVRIQGKKLNAHWFREFMDYDPIPIFERIRVRLLVVIGEHDMQVPPEDADAIGALVSGPCDVKVINDLSHILRADPESKGPRAYRKALKEPVSSDLLDTITEWIDRRRA